MVLGLCRRLLPDSHDADDAFQATFLVLLRKAGSLYWHESIGNWLYGVAYRVALKARTSAAQRRNHERQAGEVSPRETVVATDWPELRPLLDLELERVPAKYRAALVLCYLEGRSTEEAAQQLGCPVGTIKSRLARGRELLRVRLERRGLALTATALATLMEQNAVAAAVPAAMTKSLLQASRLISAGPAASAGVVSVRAAAWAEGVVKAMWMTKLKTAAVVVLTAGLIISGGLLSQRAQSWAVPIPDPGTTKKEDVGKTDPPGVPLELRLLANQKNYTLDLGGNTAKEFSTLVNAAGRRPPMAPKVDLMLELRNTSDREMKVIFKNLGQETGGMDFQLQGPGVLSAVDQTPEGGHLSTGPKQVLLGPGKSLRVAIPTLAFGARPDGGFTTCKYWTQAGDHTLIVSWQIIVSSAPKGAKDEEDGRGAVTVTSNPVILKVVEPSGGQD